MRYVNPTHVVMISDSGNEAQIPFIPNCERIIDAGTISTTPRYRISVEAIFALSIEVKYVVKTMFTPAKNKPINMILKPSIASVYNVGLFVLLNREVIIEAFVKTVK